MLTLLAALVLHQDPGPGADANLDASLSALRKDFNAAGGRPRLLILTSPTCPRCLEGIDVVQGEVLKRSKGKPLAVFVVWMRVLGGDRPEEVRFARQRIADKRAKHYWDDAAWAGRAYKKVVSVPKDRDTAMDSFLLYSSKARWEKSPPRPAFWMHQWARDGRWLDGPRMLAQIEKLLAPSLIRRPHNDASKERNCLGFQPPK